MNRRWINTLVLFDADGNVVRREGYWYDGPLALATPMASFDQEKYAFYEDGTESGSTIIGSEDTQQTLDVDTLYQCRLKIRETAGGGGNYPNNSVWQYNHNSGGFTTISTSSSVVQAADSANLTDAADTTQRLTGGGTFVTPNSWVTEDGQMPGLSFGASEVCEMLLSFQIIGSDVSNGDEILLRNGSADAFTLDADIDVNKAAAARRVFII